MHSELKKLNRFTTLPFVIDLLKRRKLSLVNPAFWEDYNDRATVEMYRKITKANAIYALCLTYENETIHHWNAFAGGTAGCCIEISPKKLFASLAKVPEIIHGKAEYLRINDLKSKKLQPHQYPFVKREPFKPENEYRLIAVSEAPQQPTFDVDIDLGIIRRITINNKMPEIIFESTKQNLLQLAPELNKKIFHSTLYNNARWTNHFLN